MPDITSIVYWQQLCVSVSMIVFEQIYRCIELRWLLLHSFFQQQADVRSSRMSCDLQHMAHRIKWRRVIRDGPKAKF